MCISIPPKYAVSTVVGYIKGKSAIQVARQFGGRQRNFTGESFWARGYFVSTVGMGGVYNLWVSYTILPELITDSSHCRYAT